MSSALLHLFGYKITIDGAGTLLCAGLGAPLRAGDKLVAAAPHGGGSRALASFATGDMIRVLAGPDLDAFAPDVLGPFAYLQNNFVWDRGLIRAAGVTAYAVRPLLDHAAACAMNRSMSAAP